MAVAYPDTRSIDDAQDDIDVEPPYHVFLWNDPVTPMQVVVLVLKKVFGYDEQKATELMLVAHRKGKAVVWTGARDPAVRYSIQLGTAGLQSTVARDS
ncbi:MAG: ATP-dependent Clp protease adaptor ClpS [Nitrososphaerales archaeon]